MGKRVSSSGNVRGNSLTAGRFGGLLKSPKSEASKVAGYIGKYLSERLRQGQNGRWLESPTRGAVITTTMMIMAPPVIMMVRCGRESRDHHAHAAAASAVSRRMVSSAAFTKKAEREYRT